MKNEKEKKIDDAITRIRKVAWGCDSPLAEIKNDDPVWTFIRVEMGILYDTNPSEE